MGGGFAGLGRRFDRHWSLRPWPRSESVVNRDISNDQIDVAYDAARSNGAIGGKITGAGGGGFMMMYCHEDKQAAVTHALQGQGLARMDFRFDFDGAQVLLNSN